MKRVTTSEYFYNEKGGIDRSVTTETIEDWSGEVDDGIVVENEIETDNDLVTAGLALVLLGVGLCFAAVGAILERNN